MIVCEIEKETLSLPSCLAIIRHPFSDSLVSNEIMYLLPTLTKTLVLILLIKSRCFKWIASTFFITCFNSTQQCLQYKLCESKFSHTRVAACITHTVCFIHRCDVDLGHGIYQMLKWKDFPLLGSWADFPDRWMKVWFI